MTIQPQLDLPASPYNILQVYADRRPLHTWHPCRYFGSRKEAAARLPFDAGFESASVVVAAGPGVTGALARLHAHVRLKHLACLYVRAAALLPLPAHACSTHNPRTNTLGLRMCTKKCAGFAPGDAVATLSYDGFAEFALAPAAQALRVPCPSAEVVAMLTSGLTASIGEWNMGHVTVGGHGVKGGPWWRPACTWLICMSDRSEACRLAMSLTSMHLGLA